MSVPLPPSPNDMTAYLKVLGDLDQDWAAVEANPACEGGGAVAVMVQSRVHVSLTYHPQNPYRPEV